MKSYTVYLWVVVLLSMALGFLIGSNQQIVQNVVRKPVTGNQKLSQFMRYLDQYYVDQVDTDSLATEVIQDLIQKLDPHSFYISKDELSRMAENMQGKFQRNRREFLYGKRYSKCSSRSSWRSQ